MPTFGEDLRREREMRGVTLEEISDSTKISMRLLKALEEDDFSKLPGGVFTRSFIRNYAQYLGLDEEHVLAEYKRTARPGSDNDFSRFTAKPLPSKSGPQTRTLPWVVAAVLLAGGYAVHRYSRRSTELPAVAVPSAASGTPAASTGSSSTASAPAAAPSMSDTSSTQGTSGAANPDSVNSSAPSSAATGASSATGASAAGGTVNAQNPAGSSSAASGAKTPVPGGTSPVGTAAGSDRQTLAASSPAGKAPAEADASTQPTLGEGDLLLQIATNDEVWLAVSADGKTLLQRLLPPNSVRTFRAKDSFDVTTGNAQGTILTLNGETQKPLGRHGEFKKLHLGRSDFQNRTP